MAAGMRNRGANVLASVIAACLLVPALLSSSQSPNYEVFAVRFAHVPYGLANLVSGAEKGPQVDIAFTVWPIRDPASGRVLLVDSGFYRDKFVQQWKPQDYVKPSEAIQKGLGIAPDKVTDVIISHSHWDHADGADLFPNATIWIQKTEYEYYVSDTGTVVNRGGADALDAEMLSKLKAAGRVRFVNGDDQEIAPGIRVYTGGKHTFESQYVGVNTRDGRVILASDNAYLYMNLEKKMAIAQTVDAKSNLAAQARMLELAPGRVVPGHDPEVFNKYPTVAANVVRIAPTQR